MPNWNGPVSTMPGHRSKPDVGAKCDDHPLVDSVATIQGETDSLFKRKYLLWKTG